MTSTIFNILNKIGYVEGLAIVIGSALAITFIFVLIFKYLINKSIKQQKEEQNNETQNTAAAD